MQLFFFILHNTEDASNTPISTASVFNCFINNGLLLNLPALFFYGCHLLLVIKFWK